MIELTIIVPCHNRPDYVQELSETIPDLPNLEVIFVDDHSQMNVFPTRAFKNAHIKKITQKSDKRGVALARNTGLEYAHGTWCIFCDDDDLLEPEELKKTLSGLKKMPDAVDIVYCSLTSFKPNGETGKRHISYAWLHSKMLSGEMKAAWRFHTPTSKAIKLSFLKHHNVWFKPNTFSEDAIFNAELLSHKPKIDVLNTAFYKIREGHESMTSDMTPSKLVKRLEALTVYNKILTASGAKEMRSPGGKDLVNLFKANPLKGLETAFILKWKKTPLFFTRWSITNKIQYKSSTRNKSGREHRT